MGNYPFAVTAGSGSSVSVSLNSFGADKTGATFSDTAIANARAALTSQFGGGNITVQPGTYKFANSYAWTPENKLGISTGLPDSWVVFEYTGSGTFFTHADPSFDLTPSSTASECGPLRGFTIDLSLAGANAIGIRCGDQNNPDVKIAVQNGTGAGNILFLADSQVGWMNGGSVDLHLSNGTICWKAANTSGLNDMSGTDWKFNTVIQPNQTAYEFTAASLVSQSSSWTSTLCAFGGVTNTGVVYSLGADNSGAGFLQNQFNSYAECDFGSGTVGPVSMAMGSGGEFESPNGIIYFISQSANFKTPTGTAAFQGWTFNGSANSNIPNDPIGNAPGFGGGAVGGTLGSNGFAGGGTIFNEQAGYFGPFTLNNGANVLALNSLVPLRAQRMLLFITQPATGAAGTLTLTGALTTAGAGVVTLSSTNGFTDTVELYTPDGVHTYATVLGLHYH